MISKDKVVRCALKQYLVRKSDITINQQHPYFFVAEIA
jgi:hypothetical protein